MFLLKSPLNTVSGHSHTTTGAKQNPMETTGEYSSLDEAIEAAIKSDLDLAVAMIEKSGGQHSVNDWINFRIAGGHYTAG
jgi:hypothetical protein